MCRINKDWHCREACEEGGPLSCASCDIAGPSKATAANHRANYITVEGEKGGRTDVRPDPAGSSCIYYIGGEGFVWGTVLSPD